MKNKKTYYQIILDRSGSMADCIEATISGFNEQMQMICGLEAKYPGQEIVAGLTQFNEEVEEIYSFRSPDDSHLLDREKFRPSGMTALLDAVGSTITNMQIKYGREIRDDEASAVVVIVTDGYENASRHFNQQQVASMIRELEAQPNWTISYIGATLDAVDVAVRMNIRRQNSMHYKKENTRELFRDLSMDMDAFVCSKSIGSANRNFLRKKDEKD